MLCLCIFTYSFKTLSDCKLWQWPSLETFTFYCVTDIHFRFSLYPAGRDVQLITLDKRYPQYRKAIQREFTSGITLPRNLPCVWLDLGWYRRFSRTGTKCCLSNSARKRARAPNIESVRTRHYKYAVAPSFSMSLTNLSTYPAALIPPLMLWF